MAKAKRKPGRPKGSRNKATKPIRDAINAKDPVGRLFELAADAATRGDHEFEHRCLSTVLPYGYPRLAASQVDVADMLKMAGNLTVVFEGEDE